MGSYCAKKKTKQTNKKLKLKNNNRFIDHINKMESLCTTRKITAPRNSYVQTEAAPVDEPRIHLKLKQSTLKVLQNLLLQSYSTTEISLPEQHSLWLVQLVNSLVMRLEALNIFLLTFSSTGISLEKKSLKSEVILTKSTFKFCLYGAYL
jgi:hypothetical protein